MWRRSCRRRLRRRPAPSSACLCMSRETSERDSSPPRGPLEISTATTRQAGFTRRPHVRGGERACDAAATSALDATPRDERLSCDPALRRGRSTTPPADAPYRCLGRTGERYAVAALSQRAKSGRAEAGVRISKRSRCEGREPCWRGSGRAGAFATCRGRTEPTVPGPCQRSPAHGHGLVVTANDRGAVRALLRRCNSTTAPAGSSPANR